jgi:hypothetical protein
MEEALEVACPKCGALPGEACKRNAPYHGVPHGHRVMAAKGDTGEWARTENRLWDEHRRKLREKAKR